MHLRNKKNRNPFIKISIVVIFLIVSACNINYSSGTDLKMKTKTIDGIDYVFTNSSKEKEFGFSFFKHKEYKNKINFYGLGKMISKEIDLEAIEKKINKKNIDFILIDSVSFAMNKNKDEVDLIYFLNFFESKEKVVFKLKKENNYWSLK